jgi:hypothetical protein
MYITNYFPFFFNICANTISNHLLKWQKSALHKIKKEEEEGKRNNFFKLINYF